MLLSKGTHGPVKAYIFHQYFDSLGIEPMTLIALSEVSESQVRVARRTNLKGLIMHTWIDYILYVHVYMLTDFCYSF